MTQLSLKLRLNVLLLCSFGARGALGTRKYLRFVGKLCSICLKVTETFSSVLKKNLRPHVAFSVRKSKSET